MTDEDAFLAKIRAFPEDDLPRLVFADFLEESGDAERAEFIRVQCELANVEVNKYHPSSFPVYEALRRRERELFIKHGMEWVGDLPGAYHTLSTHTKGGHLHYLSGEGWEFHVRRGFADEVRLTLVSFLGGECGRCVEGRRGRYIEAENDPIGQYTRWESCPTCSGTGRTEGVAKRLFEAHPVATIRLTSPRPDRTDHQRWSWSSTGFPPHVWANLHSDDTETLLSEWKGFPSEPEADAAMSAVLVAHGRSLAGLSLLTGSK